MDSEYVLILLDAMKGYTEIIVDSIYSGVGILVVTNLLFTMLLLAFLSDLKNK